MKKLIMAIVCLMTMISVNAHNVHYPTYTEDGITYLRISNNFKTIDGCKYEEWNVQKVDRPYDKTITIPFITTIKGEKAVITTIKEGAFADCVSLDSLIIEWGVWLNAKTFKGCKELEYLYYSSNSSVFSAEYNSPFFIGLSCKTLETSCGVIDDSFWKGIKNSLETLIINENNPLGGIFTGMDYCENLKTIICYAKEPPASCGTKNNYTYSCIGTVYFNSKQWSTITLYVPGESLEKYYFHSTWGEIDNIYAIDEMNNTSTSVNTIISNTVEDDVWYTLNGNRVENPTKGVYIKNGKKYMLK